MSAAEDEAAWWFANGCPDFRVPPPRPLPPQPSRSEVERYRALPAGSRNDLERLILGATPRVVDGRTHQFWSWTNRDVASVLGELTGDSEFIVAVGGGGGGWCRMTADGHRLHREKAATPGGERDPSHREPVEYRHGGPGLRYSARPPADYSGRDPGAFPPCLACLAGYTEDDFDPNAINELQVVYRFAVIEQKDRLCELERKRKEKPSAAKSRMFRLLGWLAIVIIAISIVAAMSH